MLRFPTPLVFVLLLAACDSGGNDLIDAEVKRQIQLRPVLSLSETGGDIPAAELAKQLMRLLEKEDSKLAMNLKVCAAEEYPDPKQICDNYGYGDSECAVKHGFWKTTFAKHLRVAKIDLNNDQKPDYIFTGDNCSGFAGAYTFEYFVVLSDKAGMHLAARFNSNRVDVMPETQGEGKIIVEGVSSYNGESLSIWKLDQGRYIDEKCMWRDAKEVEKNSEFHSTTCQPEPVKQKSNPQY